MVCFSAAHKPESSRKKKDYLVDYGRKRLKKKIVIILAVVKKFRKRGGRVQKKLSPKQITTKKDYRAILTHKKRARAFLQPWKKITEGGFHRLNRGYSQIILSHLLYPGCLSLNNRVLPFQQNLSFRG